MWEFFLWMGDLECFSVLFLLYNYFIEFTEVYLLLAVPLFLPKKIIILLSYFTVNCGLTLLLIKSEECTILFLDTGK